MTSSQTYGDPASAKFARAQRNFAKSLAGYSLVTYLLQIKDRHNGNILLDRDGHLIHIDFGFMLSNSPGNIGFEAAPFKLPLEYIEVLGGVNSGPYLEFRRLFRDGFEAARKHCDRIVSECTPTLYPVVPILNALCSTSRAYAKRLDAAVFHRARGANRITAARSLPTRSHTVSR